MAYGPKGIAVNEYLHSTSHPEVYAIGDAADSGLPLPPVAAKAAFVTPATCSKAATRPSTTAWCPPPCLPTRRWPPWA
ncbi:hypothetical protein J4D97_15540 [Hymenobacter defluvii]|uniref:FAD/NAD(P)-binding domain-containing protein n=1 Tax=Hymenobacter defluvii TaxID=2054411 RepID=A0ABS3TEI9_9BACT|nr:hypothetical protein [Hymenobacter defluvii]MBO3272073.1 hypothetical protein [Hymenobacter defluvii]